MPGTLLGCVGAGIGMGGEQTAHGTVLVEVTVSRRSQAMSKGVAKEATRHTF